uniref:Flavin-containing monooxygenase n=1 Tax=Solanum lycopersicum TaxID=4081 RepID=K4B4E1_SOLLC
MDAIGIADDINGRRGDKSVKEHTVVFDNGDEHQFDAVIFAIGYKKIVTKWLKDYSSIFHEYDKLIN